MTDPRALRVLDAFPKTRNVWSRTIDVLETLMRTRDPARADVRLLTLGDVCAFTEKELTTRNTGVLTITFIKTTLAQHGLALKEAPHEDRPRLAPRVGGARR